MQYPWWNGRLAGLAAVAWLLQGTFGAVNTGFFQQLSGRDPNWTAILIYSLGAAFTWWLATLACHVLLVSVTKHVPRRTSRLALLAAAGIPLVLAHRLATVFLLYYLILWTGAVNPDRLDLRNFLGVGFWQQAGNGLITYAVVLSLLAGYRYYRNHLRDAREKAALETALSRARVENLKYQLQPHFLFNSLQSISTLIFQDRSRAEAALQGVSDLLRHSLDNIDRDHIPFGEELLFLQKYIDLQRLRFGNRIVLEPDFSEHHLTIPVPANILQPIVENSIKFGLAAGRQRIHILLRTELTAGRFHLSCSDNGRGTSADKTVTGAGQGLRNLRQRLRALYGAEGTLAYGPTATGFRTEVAYPYSTHSP